MFSSTSLSSVRLGPLALLAAAALPLSLSSASGQACAGPERCPAADETCSPLDRAAWLLKDGRCVEARWVAQRVLTRDGAGDAERRRAFRLWSEADARVQSLNPLEVSLQKADLALAEGDVKTAERHARAVLGSAAADAQRIAGARRVLTDADRRRAELAPLVPEALAQAERDFLAGRYAEAKASLAMVDRSGVSLSPERRGALERYQARIVDLERSRGTVFDGDAMLGVMQPGVVRRRDDPPPPPPEPAPQPPVELPPAQPVQEQPPPLPPAQQEDLIQQALRFEAQSLLAEADRAFDEARLNDAASRYDRLRSEYRPFLTAPQQRHVEDRLAEARMRMGQQGQPLEEQVRSGQLIHEEAVVSFNHLMDESRRALDSGNPSGARELVAQARLRLNNAREFFSEKEFEQLYGQTDTMLGTIAQREQDIARREVEIRDEELRRRAEEQARAQRTERDRKINELLDRARAYQQELRYREAMEAIDQLLFLDPINPAGLLLKDLYVGMIVYREYNTLQQEKAELFAMHSVESQRATIPPRTIVGYPPDWPAISLARGEAVAFAESPENRRTLAMLEDPQRRIPSVAFSDNALEDVLSFFKDFAQVNVDVDWRSLEGAGVTRDTPVSLSLTNVTPRTMLDRVLAKVGDAGLGKADWAVSDGVVTVASDEAIRKNTVLAIYDIRDLIIEVPDYDEVPMIDLESVLQSSGGAGGGSGGRSPFQNDQGSDENRLRDRNDRIEDVIAMITDNVDSEGWVDNGGSTGKYQRLVNQGQLIITNTPRNHREIEGLLSKLRAQRSMQINVETRFLLVNQDWFEQIGFDLDVYINANNNQLRAARAFDPTVQPSDFFQNGRLVRDVTGSTRRPGSLVTPLGPGNLQPGTGTGVLTQGVVHPRSWAPIGFTQDSLGLASRLAPSAGIVADVLAGAPALGIAGQFLDDVQVDFLVQATQADRRSVQLTAPRLTFTNGQTSNIFVATQVGFVSDLEPVVSDSAVGFDPTVSVVSEGVTLLVTGTVTADRRYVTMNVDAGVSRIDGFEDQAVTAIAGGQLISSQDTASFIQLPTVTVTRVRTSVTVPDQGTILLGGQRLVTEFDIETGVPVLSKIPVLNRFFTNRIESKEEQTLLILIKPTILIQSEEEERHFPGLSDQIRFGG